MADPGDRAETALAPVRIADFVVDRIAERIGGVPPEQGGALLGLPGADYVTAFVHDADATATGVVYHNTDWLIREIAAREENSAARFKGIIHSHPAGMPRPSGQDESEYAASLRLNSNLGRYLAPIVTHDTRTPLRGHELVLGPARISFFGATRQAGRVALEPMRPVVVPIVRMLRKAGIRPDADPATVAVDGAALLATHATVPGFGAVTLLFGADFPATAPVLLADAGAEPVPLVWDLGAPPLERMAGAVLALRQERRGPRGREGRPASHPAGALTARSQGLLSPELADRRALIVGAGSVGSYLGEVLARSGVGAFTLIDPEAVEPENLGRSAYRLADVGLPKVHALADLILSINPGAQVDGYQALLDDLDAADVADAVERADLVIAATDANDAQERLGHFAYWIGRPALFPGLYRGAAGGEVIVVVEGAPCWGCSTGGVRGATSTDGGESPHRATDYGTGRLVAEPGLLVDVHHVASAAAKLALGLLHDADDPAAVARFTAGLLATRQTYAAFANEPDFWIFRDVLRDAPAQYAFQSLWLSTASRPDCPVCGAEAGRTDPSAYQDPVASADDILAYWREQSVEAAE